MCVRCSRMPLFREICGLLFFCCFKGRVGLGQRCSCVTCPTMTSAQVVKMSVTVNNSPIEEYTHSDNHIQSTHNIIAELN